MDKLQKQQIVDDYHSNDMQKLKKICDPLIYRKAVPGMYHDDLYDVASDTLLESLESYDDSKECSFKTYLTGNIHRAFYDWTRDGRRFKRCNLQIDKDGKIAKDQDGNVIIIPNIPIDAPTEDGIDLSEKVASDFNIDDELSEEFGHSFGENVNEYLKSLTKTERKIADLVIKGYNLSEIKEILKLSENNYLKILKNMSGFEKQVIIKRKDNCIQVEEEKEMENCTQTLEKSKPDRWSVASIIKKINNYTIRFDHPLQRESGQWSSVMKGNLISDILQDNPIPPLVFAEQVNNGLATIWNLDGKQRSTNVYSFKNDGFKITKKVRRWNIDYQSILKDEKGKPVLDESGFPQCEQKHFDIRGKKFSELPEELKDKFLDYNFEIVHYLNCKSEDIAYHLARYNEGKTMSASQKGIIRIGEEFAAMVKSISAMPFFKERGSYTSAEYTNGTVDRVVIESVMASNFLNEWKKDQNDMCSFMKNNVTSEMFENFEDVVDKLYQVGNDDMFELFNSKDSFLYFGLYARFVNTGLDDEKFVEFIAEFSALHNKEVNGVTFNSLCFDEEGKARSTKDKYIVLPKIELMEKLMLEYFGINIEETQTEDAENTEIIHSEIENIYIEEIIEDEEDVSIIEFVRKNVNPNTTDDDIDVYYDMLNGYKLDKKSPLLDWENEPSLIALIAYSFEKEYDLDDWIVEFFSKNNKYIENQKENYLHMQDDLEKYLEREVA